VAADLARLKHGSPLVCPAGFLILHSTSLIVKLDNTAVLRYTLAMSSWRGKGVLAPDLPRCNTKLKEHAGHCTYPAGWGTNHLGVGKCFRHDKQRKAGIYSAKLKIPTVEQAYQEFRQSDNLLDLEEEIALLSAVIRHFKEEKQYTELSDAANILSKLIGRYLEVQKERKALVPIQALWNITEEIVRILNEELTEVDRERIANRIRQIRLLPQAA